MAAEQFRWIAPDGSSHRLDSNIDGVQIVGDIDGRGLPPIRRSADVVPLQPGSRLRSAVHDENELVLGLYFVGDTPEDLRAVLRAWMARFDPTRGLGILEVTDPAGAVRQLACAYQDGLRLAEVSGMRTDQVEAVTFLAPDPYWSDTEDSQNAWTTGGTASFFPILPVRLGASQTLGTSAITNLGDVDTYPVWVIKGPGSLVQLTNEATGRVLEWNGTLGADEFIVIDGRPGNQTTAPKSVFKQDGSNEFAFLTQRDFWPLVPGVQNVSVEMSAATSDSQITLIWRNRYLSA